MPKKPGGKRSARTTLRLPDLDHSKTSVLQSLGSVASKRTYGFAINDFIVWYCSEPRLAFGRTVVLRYRYELEARRLARDVFTWDKVVERIGKVLSVPAGLESSATNNDPTTISIAPRRAG